MVRPGDSLVNITKELYGSTNQKKMKEIIELNNIVNKDMIYAGQKLIIP